MKKIIMITVMLMLVFGCTGNETEQITKKNQTPKMQTNYKEVIVQPGQPMICTMKIKNPDNQYQEYEFKIYTKSGKMRQEFVGEVGMVLILKDGMVYSTINENSSIINNSYCDWIKYDEIDPEFSKTKLGSGLSAAQKFNSTELPKMSCANANFGDEKFATPGKVCLLSELLKNLSE